MFRILSHGLSPSFYRTTTQAASMFGRALAKKILIQNQVFTSTPPRKFCAIQPKGDPEEEEDIAKLEEEFLKGLRIPETAQRLRKHNEELLGTEEDFVRRYRDVYGEETVAVYRKKMTESRWGSSSSE